MLTGLVKHKVSNVAVSGGTRILCPYAKLTNGPFRTPEVHGHVL